MGCVTLELLAFLSQRKTSMRRLFTAAYLSLTMFLAVASEVSAENREVTSNNLTFSLNLYRALHDTTGNIAFSPYSIEEALSLTLAGAKGVTAAEIRSALSLPENSSVPRVKMLREFLTKAAAADGFELRLANALWMQKEYNFLDTFKAIAKNDFHAALKTADFSHSFEKVRLEINAWVEEVTKRKIRELLKQGRVSEITRFVIVNAIYFKAAWLLPFQESATQKGIFWKTAEETVDAFFMKQQAQLQYSETDALQIVQLPYAGNSTSMLILLPKDKAGIAQLEKTLAPRELEKYVAALASEMVIVQLPRFTTRSEMSLVAALSALGVVAAFDPALADFSGIDGGRRLNISDVIHQAVVETNEQGSEAAAATAVVMRDGSAAYMPAKKPITFTADHPFIVLIRETSSGNILFMGRISNPGV